MKLKKNQVELVIEFDEDVYTLPPHFVLHLVDLLQGNHCKIIHKKHQDHSSPSDSYPEFSY